MALPVAERRSPLGGVSERPVERGCVLDCVGEHRHALEPRAVERGPDRSDHAVDHPARGHDVSACLGMGEGDAGQELERLVVQQVPVLVQHAAVAVIRVLAEADVGDDDEIRARVLEAADRLLDDAVLREALEAQRVLRRRDSEEQHCLETEGSELRSLLRQHVARQLVDPWHGRHGPTYAVSRNHEARLDEVIQAERRLPYEVAERLRPPQPPWTRSPGRQPECVQRACFRHESSAKCDTRA